MVSDEKLRERLDAAYAAFRRYPLPARLDAAPGRDPVTLLRRMSARPLRQLTGEDIGAYTGWAMTTVGGVREYKHFLPRILELTAQGGSGHMGGDAQSLAGKIIYAGWEEWPAQERAAVEAVYDACWERALTEASGYDDAEAWLCAILLLGGSLDDRLEAWLAAPLPNAGLQLASAVQSDALHDPAEPVPYWEDVRPPLHAVFQGWLASEAVRGRLRATLPLAGREAWRVEAALAGGRVAH